MRYKAVVTYDGTNYSGWQIQRGQVSVQEKIEEALERLFGTKTSIVGSGRTDAGVHAEGQVFSFESDTTIPQIRLYKAINAYLPEDIRVLSCEKTSADFNARHSAKKKTYCYRLYCSEVENPLKERYSVKIFPVDIDKMKEAAKLLIGEHDFKAFCSTGSSVKSTVRKIYSLSIKKVKEDITITVCGNGFLYNMVRIIVGTLVGVGEGRIPLDNIKKALICGDRTLVGKTLSAKGLTLKKVVY